MDAAHAEPIEELSAPLTERERNRERALARAMSSETAAVTDSASGIEIELDADDRRALRALFEARAQGRRVSIVGYDALISPHKASGLLGVSRPMVYRLIERGDLPATRVGTHWRVRTADVLSLAERRRVDLDFVESRLDRAIEVGASHGDAVAGGDAKSQWAALSDEEKDAATERVRTRARRRASR